MKGAENRPAVAVATARHRHSEATHRKAANRAVTVSAIGLALAGGIEIVIASYTHSVALLGDAIHNLSDVSTSAVVFIGFWVSKRRPTRSYPYGFNRAEDLSGLGIALVIWVSAIFAGYESYRKFVANEGTEHLAAGMLAAIVGAIGNFMVARYKLHVGREIQSATMQVEARHSWLDMLSSFGALVGLIGVATGFRWADPIAGCAVTLFICHVGYVVTKQILHHLMDGVEAEHLLAAEEAARKVPGVGSVQAKGRWMGRSLILEIEGELAPRTTIAESARIGEQVVEAVHEAVEEARQVSWIPRRYPAG